MNVHEKSWEAMLEEVLNSGKPWPTNVSTPIGEQSAEYKKAKRMANEKRNKKRAEKEGRK